MEIIIAPGAFKHSLTAHQAASAIATGLDRARLGAHLHVCPIADGGNGTLDAYLLNRGKRVNVTTFDPLMRSIEAAYGLIDDTAVIEMALASGLELVQRHELDALRATTYGTGVLLNAALDAGAKRMIVGLGGSATTDGGAGCLQALGIRLLDDQGNDVPPGGGNLNRVRTIDISRLDPRWREVEVIIASDVDNPALGERGAAAVFAPQKGASPEEVPLLEANLRHFFTLVYEQLGVDVRDVPGGGAAGAFAAGLMAFLNGKIRSGIDLILEHVGFDDLLATADLVITGEGRMDEQTIGGKGPIGVARRAHERGVKTVALVGGLEADDVLLHEAGVWAVLPIVDRPMLLDEALKRAPELLERAATRLGYLLQV
ncbi:MAG TPA: glycerate kinase [Oceanobacillus sp.]|nr:glycerate kinase [Oceanobacillus sp.]